jgi:hypothetical protein
MLLRGPWGVITASSLTVGLSPGPPKFKRQGNALWESVHPHILRRPGGFVLASLPNPGPQLDADVLPFVQYRWFPTFFFSTRHHLHAHIALETKGSVRPGRVCFVTMYLAWIGPQGRKGSGLKLVQHVYSHVEAAL